MSKLLVENRRVTPDPWTGPGPYLVNLQPEDDLRALLSMGGQAVLDGHFVDPFQMMAQAMGDEYKCGTITFDAKTGRLARTNGPCRSASTTNGSFPEGCALRQTRRAGAAAGTARRRRRGILAKSKDAVRQAAAMVATAGVHP